MHVLRQNPGSAARTGLTAAGAFGSCCTGAWRVLLSVGGLVSISSSCPPCVVAPLGDLAFLQMKSKRRNGLDFDLDRFNARTRRGQGRKEEEEMAKRPMQARATKTIAGLLV